MKFKIGDKVRLSEVGEANHKNSGSNPHYRIGTVIEDSLESDYNLSIRVNWPFGYYNAYKEEDLELVFAYMPQVSEPSDRVKIKSDGGSTDYYKIPEHATELRHLISYKSMSKSRGDIFKACYRLGEKDGVDVMYELNKMEFFVKDLKEMYERGEMI